MSPRGFERSSQKRSFERNADYAPYIKNLVCRPEDASGQGHVLADESIFLSEDEPQVRQAIRGLVFARWFYLRDATKYSILLDPARKESFAVVGLTDPLATFFGGASMSFEAGVCPLDDRFICDGLFADAFYVGPNMRSDFRTLHSEVARQSSTNGHEGEQGVRSQRPSLSRLAGLV